MVENAVILQEAFPIAGLVVKPRVYISRRLTGVPVEKRYLTHKLKRRGRQF
jgi:hypothetical protein